MLTFAASQHQKEETKAFIENRSCKFAYVYRQIRENPKSLIFVNMSFTDFYGIETFEKLLRFDKFISVNEVFGKLGSQRGQSSREKTRTLQA
jgi:hypothetical protein